MIAALGSLRIDRVIFLQVVSFLDPHSLLRSSAVSWAFFAACSAEEIWRDIVLAVFVNDDKVATFQYFFSWKQTYRNTLTPLKSCKLATLHHSQLKASFAVNCYLTSGYVLNPPAHAFTCESESFVRYNVVGMNLLALPMNLNGVPRVHCISRRRFIDEYEIPNRPVIITGLMDNWPALTKWKMQNLVRDVPNLLLKTNSRSTNGKRFRMKLADFAAYCNQYNGEKPLYVFDKKVVQSSTLVGDYAVPEHFSEDLFELMEEDDRPDYRWLLIGPNGSGSPFHTDPHDSSAWNAVVEGIKRVSFYPPSVIPPGVDEELIHSDYYASEDSMKWYRFVFPTLSESELPIECLVQPGEILFIPSGWWHQVQNIGTTIAVTQNFCSQITFPRVAAHMNKYARKGVRKDFKIALSESDDFQSLASHIVVNKKVV